MQEPQRKADLLRIRKENSAGPFFTDDECISCGACWALAPALIKSHAIHTFAFFQRQPESIEEWKLCREALKICPVGAIGEKNEPLSID